jgi:hypothetical protein
VLLKMTVDAVNARVALLPRKGAGKKLHNPRISIQLRKRQVIVAPPTP